MCNEKARRIKRRNANIYIIYSVLCSCVFCETRTYGSPTYGRKENMRRIGSKGQNARALRSVRIYSYFFHSEDERTQSRCHFHYSRVRNDTYAARQRTYANTATERHPNSWSIWNEMNRENTFYFDGCLLRSARQPVRSDIAARSTIDRRVCTMWSLISNLICPLQTTCGVGGFKMKM